MTTACNINYFYLSCSSSTPCLDHLIEEYRMFRKCMSYLFLRISESILFMSYLGGISIFSLTAYRQATHTKKVLFYVISGIFVVSIGSQPCDEDTDRKIYIKVFVCHGVGKFIAFTLRVQ